MIITIEKRVVVPVDSIGGEVGYTLYLVSCVDVYGNPKNKRFVDKENGKERMLAFLDAVLSKPYIDGTNWD